jgi:long-chain fatty acid transport protein
MLRFFGTLLFSLIFLLPTFLHATNGDHLIGVGAKSRGMGGTGIGIHHGSEAVLSNPALIAQVDSDELFIGGTLFMPDVQTDIGGGYKKSDADLSLIPEIAVADHVNDKFFWGVGMFGTAGMGVDYRDDLANMQMMTNLQLMQFAVPLAYKANGLSIGVTPIIQYGSLDMTYTGSTTSGISHDFGAGFHIGVAYVYEQLTIGAVYKSAIDMKYENQLSKAMEDFTGLPGFSDHLEQPEEVGIGLSYRFGSHVLAFDYKVIGWGSAKGYESFGWKDQNVYAVGYQYESDHWSVRAGYNHAKHPIRDQGVAGGLINTLNLLGFPAIVEDHYTVGFSKEISKVMTVDLAITYADEEKVSYASMFHSQNVSTMHSQTGITIGVVRLF